MVVPENLCLNTTEHSEISVSAPICWITVNPELKILWCLWFCWIIQCQNCHCWHDWTGVVWLISSISTNFTLPFTCFCRSRKTDLFKCISRLPCYLASECVQEIGGRRKWVKDYSPGPIPTRSPLLSIVDMVVCCHKSLLLLIQSYSAAYCDSSTLLHYFCKQYLW